MTDKAKAQYFTFLLRCKDIHLVPEVVANVIEETMIDLLAGGSEPRDWRNLYRHHDYLNDRVFREDGEVNIFCSEHEYWEFLKDPAAAFLGYQEQIANYLEDFTHQNDSILYTLRQRMDIQDIQVARVFPDQWLFSALGVKR